MLAEDGEEAVRIFAQHPDGIAVVLLDMSMPRMGGEEACSEIRRIRPGAPVILSSGFDEQDSAGRLVGRGLAGFIQKPYPLAELVAKVRAACVSGEEGD